MVRRLGHAHEGRSQQQGARNAHCEPDLDGAFPFLVPDTY